jgi:hypothetical protein
MTTNGIVISTFTPLKGVSETVLHLQAQAEENKASVISVQHGMMLPIYPKISKLNYLQHYHHTKEMQGLRVFLRLVLVLYILY